ncbi:MAG: aldo/keto reductase [Bacteroidales bacterium]|nr:aldo/keto reductase [Bacteroidales bacterium]MCF8388537.1 aldo/keto reductase [Bacteroidales bacterium]
MVLTTKVGLDWDEDADEKQPVRNSSPERIMKEIDDSLRRLQTDYIDIYLVHWPDPLEAFEKTAMSLYRLLEIGKIRSIGVSNYSTDQMEQFRAGGPLHVNEPPFNLFERKIEEDVLPYCKKNEIRTLGYGALCRGLLSGKMSQDREFKGDDLRKYDPKFQGKQFEQYLNAVKKLDTFARKNYGKQVIHLAVRWILDQGISTALWGARRPKQLEAIDQVSGWHIDDDAMQEIDQILKETIKDPVGPEFMGPPSQEDK